MRKLGWALLALCFSVAVRSEPEAFQTYYCETDCGENTPCDYACMYGGSGTTCGEYNGGVANGMCTEGCGDGVCASNEDEDTCPNDCVMDADAEATVVFPSSGPPWSKFYSNWPNQDQVSDCFGNCGPGCSQYSLTICGSQDQYWELEVLTQPSVGTNSNYCFCVDDNNLYECGSLTTYAAYGRWTYHGWSAAGCYSHDVTCRTSWWLNAWIGLVGAIVTPGWSWADLWIQFLINPYVTCKLSFASFAYGGGCLGAGSDEWSYETTLYTDEFSHDHYEYGPTGSCYVGPPKCGDGICQTNTCDTGGSGTETPGDGCEEQGGFNSVACWDDCS